jgi:hypothetical protein
MGMKKARARGRPGLLGEGFGEEEGIILRP